MIDIYFSCSIETIDVIKSSFPNLGTNTLWTKIEYKHFSCLK